MKRDFRTNGKERPATNGNALKFSAHTQTKRNTELFYFRLNGRKSQCKKCLAENVPIAADQLCFDCEQRGEFFWREILTPEQRAHHLANSVSGMVSV